MRSVWKFNVNPGRQVIEVPSATKWLSAHAQGDDIVLYGLVDPDEPARERVDVRVVCTGEELPYGDGSYEYLGTVKLYDGLMFHVFYRSRRAVL